MAPRHVSHRLHRSIFVYAAVSILAIGVIVAAVAILPLYAYLTKEAERSLVFTLRIQASSVEQYVTRVSEVARQIAGRHPPGHHPTRSALKAKPAGRTSLGFDSSASWTRSILTDALHQSREARGITRIGHDGALIAQVGEPIPEEIRRLEPPDDGEVAIRGPLNVGGSSYVLAIAPIAGPSGSWSGTDFILFEVSGLHRLLRRADDRWQSDAIIMGVRLDDGTLQVFSPLDATAGRAAASPPRSEGLSSSLLRGALEKALRQETGVLSPGESQGHRVLMAYGPVRGAPWGMVIRMDQAELYAPIHRQVVLVGAVILALIGAGTFGVVLLLRPRTGKLILRADDLEKEVLEKTAALEAELAERVRAEVELSRMAAIVESSADAIIGLSPDGVIGSWNSGAEKLYGYRAEEVLGKPIKLLLAADSPDDLPQLHARITRGEEVEHFETVRRRKDGRDIHISASLSPICDVEDKVIGISMIARDITKRKRTEAELRQAHVQLTEREAALRETMEDLRQSHEALEEAQLQLIQAVKMESVGRLAAGVAHEVKNPLAIVLVGISYLAHHLPTTNANVTMAIDDIRDAIRRADAVISGLLNYSAERKLELTVEDLSDVAKQSLLLVKHQPEKQHVIVVRDLADNLPWVKLDKTKIEQVFVNLFMNAIDAMAGGGTLTVRTHATTLTKPGPHVGKRAGDRFRIGESVVVAEVEDTGSGIAENHLGKIYDPFFTTKPTGKGTGLGLAVTKTIIEMHRGVIDIRNRDEGGVRVTLMFKADGGDTTS